MLDCYYIDCDGERFGPVRTVFKINPYQGEKEIRSLEIYPLKYAKNASELQSHLRTRGLKFCEFKSPNPPPLRTLGGGGVSEHCQRGQRQQQQRQRQCQRRSCSLDSGLRFTS